MIRRIVAALGAMHTMKTGTVRDSEPGHFASTGKSANPNMN
ncbi:hypothetical protein [Streptomyces flaveolus]